MFVSTQQIQIGATNFVEQEVAKYATGKEKFGYYFALPRIPRIVEDYINGYRNNIMCVDFFDENGNIDIDKLYNEAVEAIRKSGKFVMYGIWVSEDTLKTIYSYIVR